MGVSRLGCSRVAYPGSKMKIGQDHVVPLVSQTVDILRGLHLMTGHGQFVFPSIRTGERCMSEDTVNAALHGMAIAKK